LKKNCKKISTNCVKQLQFFLRLYIYLLLYENLLANRIGHARGATRRASNDQLRFASKWYGLTPGVSLPLSRSPGVSAVIAIIVTVSIVQTGAEQSTSRSDRRPSSLHIEQVVAWFSADCSILRAAPTTTSHSHTRFLCTPETHTYVWLARLTSPTHNSYEATPKAVGEPRELARSSIHPSVHLHPPIYIHSSVSSSRIVVRVRAKHEGDRPR